MKKKMVMILLVMAMAVTGCGNRIEGDGKVQAAMADAGNNQENFESGEDEAAAPEPTAEPTEEPDSEPENIPETENVETPETTADTSEEDAAVKDGSGYSFEEMEEFMYVKCSVNLRSLPSTAGEKIRKLTGGQEALVTGKCIETGWYRIQLVNSNGDITIGYVSSSYLVEEMDEVTGASSGNSKTETANTDTSKNTTQNQGSNGGSGASGGSQPSASEEPGQHTVTSSGTSGSFVDYLNAQRAAAGLNQLSWDDGLAAEAQRRAEAVVNDFSHNGSGNYLENLYSGGSSSDADWYNAWYNSAGHRATMMNTDAVSAGCAYVQVDGMYYAVLIIHTEVKVQTAQEWNDYKEEAVASGEMDHYHVSDEEGTITDVYAEGGEVEIVTDDQLNEDLDAVLRAAGLIP